MLDKQEVKYVRSSPYWYKVDFGWERWYNIVSMKRRLYILAIVVFISACSTRESDETVTAVKEIVPKGDINQKEPVASSESRNNPLGKPAQWEKVVEKPIELTPVSEEEIPAWQKRFYALRKKNGKPYAIADTGASHPTQYFIVAIRLMLDEKLEKRRLGYTYLESSLSNVLFVEVSNQIGFDPASSSQERSMAVKRLKEWMEGNESYLTYLYEYRGSSERKVTVDEQARAARVPLLYWRLMSTEEKQLALEEAAESIKKSR